MDELVDTNLPLKESEIGFMEEFYEKGDDVQKLSVIQSLPQLIQLDSISTFNRIIPKIIQELPKASCEYQIATSRIFRILMEKQLPINLLTPVLHGLEFRDMIVANSWLETLLCIIPWLTESQIKRDVLPLAQSKAVMTKSVFNRISSAKILGKICVHQKSEAFEIKKNVLPTIQALCQDVNAEVRAITCAQLPFVAEGLGDELIKTNMMSNIVELAADDSPLVKSASVVTVVLIIPNLSHDVKVHTIIPLIKKLCSVSTEEGDITFTTVSREFGKILDSLRNDLSEDDSMWFLQFYKILSQKGFSGKAFQSEIEPSQGVVCRQQCAFNLPAVTFFTMNKIPSQLNFWYSIFRELAGDPCYLVRKTVAGCIHEIAKILGVQCKMIKQDVIRLLRDDAEEVLQMIVPNLGTTLELFSSYGLLSRETPSHSTLEIGRAVLKCQMELSSGFNWRMQTHFMFQLERLPNCMPSDFIHQHFTPVILNIAVQGRARPVRSQATRTLLVFLRYNMKEIQRKWIRDTLIARLCYSSSCYTRHIYIMMCSHAMEIFSFKYFKEFFYIPLLGLADDPVSNIRLCLAHIIPQLRQMLTAEDRKLQQCLDNVLSKLEVVETNRDVMSVYRIKMKEHKGMDNERNNEERRKQDEENKIMQGKFIGPRKMNGALKTFSGSQLTTSSISNNPKSPSVTRSPSAPPSRQVTVQQPPRSGVPPASDMSFLEQHFYIDAGINLKKCVEKNSRIPSSTSRCNSAEELPPLNSHKMENSDKQVETLSIKLDKNLSSTESSAESDIDLKKTGKILSEKMNSEENASKIPTVSVENINIETLSEKDINNLEKSTTNITDEVKVNLRRLKNNNVDISVNNLHIHKEGTKISKRHSIISLLPSAENVNKKVLNRRSLNIPKDMSRIPVSFNPLKNKAVSDETSTTTKDSAKENTIKRDAAKEKSEKLENRKSINNENMSYFRGKKVSDATLKFKRETIVFKTINNCVDDAKKKQEIKSSNNSQKLDVINADAFFNSKSELETGAVNTNDLLQKEEINANIDCSTDISKDNNKNKLMKSSHLPVFVRRTQSEVRK